MQPSPPPECLNFVLIYLLETEKENEAWLFMLKSGPVYFTGVNKQIKVPVSTCKKLQEANYKFKIIEVDGRRVISE